MADGRNCLLCTHHVIGTETCGNLDAWVQGDLSTKKPVILTVHDMGSNHKSFHGFMEHPAMADIKTRVILVHVDLPGQADGSPDLPESYTFPTMQQLGNDLVSVLDQLRIKYVIGLGEGSGANIVARFALLHPKRCLGVALIHPTSTTAGIMEFVKDKIIGSKLKSGLLMPSAEDYLVFHKFGEKVAAVEEADRQRLIEEYSEHLKNQINPKNLNRYVQSFLNRTEIASQLKNMPVDTLVIVGGKASHLHTTYTFHSHLPMDKRSLLTIDNCGDVLNENPDKVAHSLQLFFQGCGILSSLKTPGQEGERSSSMTMGEDGRLRKMSMQDYDKPRSQQPGVSF